MGVFLTVLLSILTIVLFVVLVALFLLFSPVWVHVVYKDNLKVVGGYSFYRTKIIPADEEKKKRKRKAKTIEKTDKDKAVQNTAESNPKNVPKAQHKASEDDTSDSISEKITQTCSLIGKFLNMLGKSARIDIKELNAVISREDAAKTAVTFGICSGAVSTVLAICSNAKKCKVNNQKVGVTPDFLKGKCSFRCDVKIKVPAISILLNLMNEV